jgi:hypothetical protein
MTFEERLDRIAERHEALAQTVELMARMHQDFERSQHEAMSKTQTMLADVVESIDSLARIAHLHERRITGLEGGRV